LGSQKIFKSVPINFIYANIETLKQIIIIPVKLLIAAMLLYYLKSSGRLNLAVLSKIGFHSLAVTIPFYFFSFFWGILRWRIIAKACNLPLSLWSATRLSMSGNWISSIVPGGSLFSGDVARATIFALENKEMRLMGLTSIIVDRILGLLSILIICVLSLLVNFHLLNRNAWLRFMSLVLAFFVVVFIVMLVLLLSKKASDFLIFSDYLKTIPGIKIFLDILNNFYIFRNDVPSLLKAHLVSYLGHISMMIAIFNLAHHIGISLGTKSEYFFAISLGIMTATLPISGPVGVGAGNVGFALSFGVVNSSSGADLALAWQLTFIMASQVGLFFFMLNRKKNGFPF